MNNLMHYNNDFAYQNIYKPILFKKDIKIIRKDIIKV